MPWFSSDCIETLEEINIRAKSILRYGELLNGTVFK